MQRRTEHNTGCTVLCCVRLARRPRPRGRRQEFGRCAAASSPDSTATVATNKAPVGPPRPLEQIDATDSGGPSVRRQSSGNNSNSNNNNSDDDDDDDVDRSSRLDLAALGLDGGESSI
jgi:hypothetical protein